MPRRLPVTLFIFAIAGMILALGWMGVQWREQTAADSALEQTSKKRKTSPLLPANLPPPQAPALELKAEPTLASTIADALENPEALEGEALLTLKSPEALAAFRARAALNGIDIISIDPKLLTARVRYRDLAGLQKELAVHGTDFTHAGPNLLARIPGLPSPPQTDKANAGGSAPFRSQGLDLIGAPANRSGWGKGVTVAVLDSGVTAHPSLKNTSITHLDLVEDGQPFHGHGTAMASLIAGQDGSVSGVSPDANILDVRIADPSGNSNTSLLSSGIVQAVDAGARVINISLGSQQSSPVLEQAVAYALSRGVVIVAAAGNEQANALSYPAGIPGVISVGAVDANGTQAWFSNSGQGLSFVAPGVGIVSAYVDGKLVIGSGTSQAAAIASGVAAYAYGRGYPGQNIPTVLIRNARPTGAAQTAVGAGILHIP